MMNYFKNENNEVFAYDDEQIEQGFGKDEDGNEIQIKPSYVKDDWVAITKEEVDAINKAKEDEYKATAEYKLSEAKTYLADTDWIIVKISEATAMGANVEELKTKYAEQLIGRSEARYKINELEG